MEPMDLPAATIDPTAFVAPTARIYGDVEIGRLAVIMFGVVMRAELAPISVGDETNLQDNAVFHADEGVPCTIGRRVTVGHGAIVHGATVGDRCLIGIGAIVLSGSRVGEGAWLAAGSILPEGKEIPPWTLGVGIPARPLRDLTEAEIARQDDGVDTYLRFAATYRNLASG